MLHTFAMRDTIHIAYRRCHKVAPWFNWIKPRDESYDGISDHEDRISAIVDVIAEISSWTDAELAVFMEESRDTCLHNLEVLRSAADLRGYVGKLDQLFG